MNPERLYGILNTMTAQIESEISRQAQITQTMTVSKWNICITALEDILLARTENTALYMQRVFGLSADETAELFRPEYDAGALKRHTPQ